MIFFVRKTTTTLVVSQWNTIIFASIAAVAYLVGIYMLLRHYFDVMVATDSHLYIVLWDSFFKYRIKIITRGSIQDISLIPAAGISVLRRDEHIYIATEQDDLIEFNHVYNASIVVRDMYDIRDSHRIVHNEEVEINQEHSGIGSDDEKFKILVETL